MRDHDISQRRACRLVGVDPKTVRRERPPDHDDVRAAMREIAGQRRRFGYRRIGVLLERKGMVMNHKKLYRLYRDEGLSVKRRRGRKRARGTRIPMPVPVQPNARWSMDFLSDTFGASRRFRILAVNDDCCRENLCLIADTSISGARVTRELDALVRIYGKPDCIVSDNGTEFTSSAILKWADNNKVAWHYIDPGKPQQNGFILRRGKQSPGLFSDPSSPSTAACATSSSTRSCSTVCPTPGGSWRVGDATTTTSGLTRPWTIWHPRTRAGRLSNPRAPRPARLRHQAQPDTQKSPADSRCD